ncbi:MAG: cysteine--tRNA ligase [Blastochloris viridis]|uniref:Cysteine--tRNA ligase n=1 Tax=Blastochloris viridis TaxID=1079 RepID=A0A6N4R4N3_BLAVI|nr:MAG: cysteine--tRNA ligase [Blastochloris viridis]
MTHAKLKLYNTLTRDKQEFKPLDIDADGNVQSVRMYVCGITPYDYAHIGNLRTIVVFDVLYRLLRHIYPNKVEYVRNYTDIDDKIVQRAAEKGIDPFALSDEFIGIFERDMARMNVLDLPRKQKPRVSDYMREIVAMVNGLLEKGSAYVTASGDVMLSVPEFEKLGAPHQAFGHIARRTFDNLQARVEEDAEKRDTRDFPIWKANSKSATKLEQAFLPRELGATFEGFEAPGRPGWHIECSVMSEQLLGTKYKKGDSALFDLHGGGEDLAFPHHSCEIAQTEAFHPECVMSSVWMHVAFLTVEGQKMSKSLNNFILVEDALKKYSPEAIRLWLLQTHYRKPVDYSDEALTAVENRIKRWRNQLEGVEADVAGADALLNVLTDDLDTARALAIIEELSPAQKRGALELLGIEFATTEQVASENETALLDARIAARASKDWAESDRLRDVLKNEHGIIVEDGPNGQTWRRV